MCPEKLIYMKQQELMHKTSIFITIYCLFSALISGTFHRVPDTALTAESSWDTDINHGAHCSRLNTPKPEFCYSNAWQRGDWNTGWIQVRISLNSYA